MPETAPLSAAELAGLDAFLDAIADVYRAAVLEHDEDAAWGESPPGDGRALVEHTSRLARASLAWLADVRARNRPRPRSQAVDRSAWAWARVVVAGCPSQPSRDGAWSFDRIRPLARRWLAALAAGEVSAREVVGGLRIVGSELLEPGEGCGGFRLLDASGRATHAARVAAEAIARGERVRAYEARRGLIVPPLADAMQLAAAHGGRTIDAETVAVELQRELARDRGRSPIDRAAFALNAIAGLPVNDARSPSLSFRREGEGAFGKRGRVTDRAVDGRTTTPRERAAELARRDEAMFGRR